MYHVSLVPAWACDAASRTEERVATAMTASATDGHSHDGGVLQRPSPQMLRDFGMPKWKSLVHERGKCQCERLLGNET